MSIERIAPASQFPAQSTNNLLQNVQNDRRSTAVTDRDRDNRDNGARDEDRDGGDDDDVEMPSLLLDDRHPPSTSSAYILFSFSFFLSFSLSSLFLSLDLGFGWTGGWIGQAYSLPHIIASSLPPFRSVPILHCHHTSFTQTGRPARGYARYAQYVTHYTPTFPHVVDDDDNDQGGASGTLEESNKRDRPDRARLSSPRLASSA